MIKFISIAITLFSILPGRASPLRIMDPGDSVTTSGRQQALNFLEKIIGLDSSAHWPNVKPRWFIENLHTNITTPLAMYQGSNTNFCGYAALSYLPLHDDPLGYVKFMLELYRDGKAHWGSTAFDPSPEIKLAAGTLHFKGILDIRPADQMWFLILADHFKGYLNIFFPHYHPGSENTFWASVNFGKFNRIIRHLLGYEVRTVGSDLIRPGLHDLFVYLSQSVKTGTTFLYVNNTYLHKKDHNKSRASFPTHFIVLTDIWQTGDDLTIIYWDYGGRTLRQVKPAFLKKILFGVSRCTKKNPMPTKLPHQTTPFRALPGRSLPFRSLPFRALPFRMLLYSVLLYSCCCMFSCTSLNITNYYHKHQSALDSIEHSYKKAYQEKPFSIEFTDRPFKHVSLELMTGSLTYIYEFGVDESRITDSLRKYGFNAPAINALITQMRSVECTWVNNLDYYIEENKQSLIYISLWPRIFNSPFVNKKYYILAYFSLPQYFDSEGNLMAGRRLRRIRKINGETFKKINAQVCYTLSDRFR